MDQNQSLKHFCRICKKGFGCGRALGGHMRAHGIGEDSGHVDDEYPVSDGEEKLPNSGNKRMYALRTNPNRFKSCRICENCGKEFLSWKSFLEHGKCSSDMDSLVSSPEPDEDDDGGGGGGGGGNDGPGCGGWSKRKRTRRIGISNSNCPSSEEEDLANCLVMLSTARFDPLIAETEESCGSASKEEERRNTVGIVTSNHISGVGEKAKVVVGKGLFECKACKKVFSSHQALGGHRASHKKVKGCFAAKLDDLDESLTEEDGVTHDEFFIPTQTQGLTFDHNYSQAPLMAAPKRKSKVHECSICHRIFSSGQALGGHKRCHWVTSNTSDNSFAKLQQLQDQTQQQQQRPTINKSEPLDLNLPAPLHDLAGNRDDDEIPLALEPPTAIYLWQAGDDDNNNSNTNKINNNSVLAVDDDADSKIKLEKLQAMGLGGGSSPWLQVGIGSATNGSTDP